VTTPLTITSVTAATHTITKSGGGLVNGDYLTVSYSIASPSTTFYAYNSTNSGNNTDWTFPSTTPVGGSLFFGAGF